MHAMRVAGLFNASGRRSRYHALMGRNIPPAQRVIMTFLSKKDNTVRISVDSEMNCNLFSLRSKVMLAKTSPTMAGVGLPSFLYTSFLNRENNRSKSTNGSQRARSVPVAATRKNLVGSANAVLPVVATQRRCQHMKSGVTTIDLTFFLQP